MGAAKEELMRQMEADQDDTICLECEKKLDEEEFNSDRGICFNCYCDSQGD